MNEDDPILRGLGVLPVHLWDVGFVVLQNVVGGILVLDDVFWYRVHA